MQVSQAMSTKVITIQPDASIAEAIDLMLGSHVSGLPVVDREGTLVGLLSEGDLLRRAELGTQKPRARWIEVLLGPGKAAEAYVQTHGRKVEELMTADPIAIAPGADLSEAVDLLNRHKIKRLPVTLEGRVVGILTRADLLRALAKLLPAKREGVPDAAIRSSILSQLEAQAWAPTALIEIGVRDGIVTLSGTILDDRERAALRVIAENTPGVRSVEDQLTWTAPISGIVPM
jgi:CBS domain-containing protein